MKYTTKNCSELVELQQKYSEFILKRKYFRSKNSFKLISNKIFSVE